MKPWIHLASTPIPGGGSLELFQHVRDYAIRLGREDLMNSQTHGSEGALARLAWERRRPAGPVDVLIGGLGMGFTVAAALQASGSEDRIQVVELVPGVVDWNRGPLAHLAGHPLKDPRVRVDIDDVGAVLRRRTAAYDIILLDVDNGPHGLTTPANHWLYGDAGLRAARAALRPGGVYAVWSAGPDDAFTRRLKQRGFAVEAVRVPAHGSRGRKHVIWLAIAV